MFKWKPNTVEGTDDLYYDVLGGNVLEPHTSLDDPKQAKEVADAIALVNTYIAHAEADGQLEIM